MSLYVPTSDQNYLESIDLPSSAGKPSGFIENNVREGTYAWKTRTSTAEHSLKTMALERSKDEFNKLVDEGVIDMPKLENPGFTGRVGSVKEPETPSGFENLEDLAGFATTAVPGIAGITGVPQDSLKTFTNMLKKANEQIGQEKFKLTSPEKVNKAFKEEIQQSKREIERFRERSKATAGTVGSFTGPIIAETVGDPIDAASLAFGARAGASMLKTAGWEFVIGGSAEALQQPFVQEYRNDVGLEAGPKQALSNILMVSVGSATLGGGIRGLIDGGDKVAKHFGLRGPGFEQAGKQIAEKLDKFPDSVKKSFMDGTATMDDYAEILNFEMRKGNLDPQQKAAYKMHEAAKTLKESNPYDNGNVPKIERGRLSHIENLTKAQRAIQENRTPNIDPDRHPEPLRMDRVGYTRETVDPGQIDFEDQPMPVGTERSLEKADLGEGVGVDPVLFKKENGQMSVMRGRDQIATGRPDENINAVVIDGRQHDINDARAWIMGRDAELHNASKSDVSEVTGQTKTEMRDLSQSQWSRDMTSLMKLDEKAFRIMGGQRIPTNVAREVAERVDDPETQRRAMRVLGGIEKGGEADAVEVIKRGVKNGFSEEQSTEIIETMDTIRQSAIKDLDDGTRTLTINGDDVNVDGGFVKGLRQLSKSRTPISRSLRNATRQATDESSTRSGVDEFIRQIAQDFEQGNISRADVRQAGAFQKGREEVQQIIAERAEDTREAFESVRRGDSDKLDELEESVREKFGEDDTVDVKEKDIDGNTVEREMSVGERLDKIDSQKEEVNALRECLI